MIRRRLGWAVVALVLVFAVGWVMVLLTAANDIRYDPQNPADRGAEAIASVLAAEGVTVHRVTNVPDAVEQSGADTAVLVSDPRTLSSDRLRELASGTRGSARLILVTPAPAQLAEAFDLPDEVTYFPGPTASGQCELPWGSGLSMPPNSVGYTLPDGAAGCFTKDGASAAYEVPASSDRPALLVLGSENVLTNATMKSGDNAALGLRALGQNRQLVWVSGGFDGNSPAAQEPSVWPKWIGPALWLTLAACLLLMFWRGRRLGRLVTEPLPVIVPANETTVARGQLYRHARDTVRTAAVLRSATRSRLATYLGVPPGAARDALIHQVAVHTGRDEREVAALLTDDPRPLDETTLSRLAENLSALERQARR